MQPCLICLHDISSVPHLLEDLIAGLIISLVPPHPGLQQKRWHAGRLDRVDHLFSAVSSVVASHTDAPDEETLPRQRDDAAPV